MAGAYDDQGDRTVEGRTLVDLHCIATSPPETVKPVAALAALSAESRIATIHPPDWYHLLL